MELYANRSGNSGVFAFEIGQNYIVVTFTSGSVYEYTYSSAGVDNIESMKAYALSGAGLNSFIQRYVRKKYSNRIR